MMNKAFLDTTILTNCLLKLGSDMERHARAAIHCFDHTELPVYAIKEFKHSPLQHYAYVYNLLLEKRNLAEVYEALAKLSPMQSRKRNTALEALATATRLASSQTFSDLEDTYGAIASPERMVQDRMAYALKSLIFLAWRNRRKLTDQVVEPLPCYQEKGPEIKRDRIELAPRTCSTTQEVCAVSEAMRKDLAAVADLQRAAKKGADAEDSRMIQALHLVHKNRMAVDDKTCRALGDAVFAFCAPADAMILTTNIKDHRPLAEALGKHAATPLEVLSQEDSDQ